MPVQLRSLMERIRDSQFLLPAVSIAIGFALAGLTSNLDERGTSHALVISSSVMTARTLLATVAGAIITAAALVFSLSAVTLQLAATQYSPKVAQGFLRDRLQQAVFGLAMGTFTYTLVALATLPSDPSISTRADWTTTTAVALAVVTAVGIVAFIDHTLRRVRVDDVIRQIASRTQEAFVSRRDEAAVDDQPWEVEDIDAVVVRSDHAGFVQAIDLDAMIASLPAGSVARLDVWTGHFVIEGSRLVTIWTTTPGSASEAVKRAIAIGNQRTIEQDPAHGIRQLVDIALRSLSSGINDPATAADVVRHLSGCVRSAYLAGDLDRIYHSETGARLYAPLAPKVSSHVDSAFAPIRRAAHEQPLVLKALSDALLALNEELTELGIDSSALRREAERARIRRRQVLTSEETGNAERDSA